MTRIGLISDTHGFLDENIFEHFKDCDEIWHAGDWGAVDLAQRLSKWSDGDRQTIRQTIRRIKGVYGNIDDQAIRSLYPEQIVFMCEDVKVMIRHIGGSPPRYNPETRKQLAIHQPKLFICGHSHILKVMYDEKMDCLYMNPGAAGKHGWHKMRTILRFSIDGSNIKDCEVVELGRR